MISSELTKDIKEELKNKSILITGGTGFFGKNLCEALKQVEMKIFSLARKRVEYSGIEFIEHDITKPIEQNFKVDYIIHAATPVIIDKNNEAQIIDIIVNGTQQVLNFAEKIKCSKVLIVSSGAVYGPQPDEVKNISENYVLKESFYNFNSAYTTGKRISELMALEWAKRTNIHLSIARCFAFSGPHLPLDQHLAIGNFIGDALKKKVINIKGDGSAVRSYMDAADLVTWLISILLHGKKGEAYNVGSDQEISMKDLAYKISQKVPGSQVVIQNTESCKTRNRYIPSVEKAKSELNLQIKINLDESIQKMIDFNKGIYE